jgi:hypothetical protein
MPCRPFTLLDALILVGGAAVGFAGCRMEGGWLGDWYFRVEWFVEFSLMLTVWLVLIFRVRRPRPSIRLMARQPGVVACFAVAVMQVVQFADTLFHWLIIGPMGYVIGVGPAILSFFEGFNATSAAVVPISWAILIANRRWRPEPGWIDGSGRIVGWIWIAWMFAWPLIYWLANRYALNGPMM